MVRRNTGISIRRLTLLCADPTFQELIAVKGRKAQERWDQSIDAYTEMAIGNLMAAEGQLTDKLAAAEETGELLPTRELIAIVSDRADRFGYSKHTVVKHEHDFAAALDRAIARSGKQIEGTATELAAPATAQLPAPSGPPPSCGETQREEDQPSRQEVDDLALPSRAHPREPDGQSSAPQPSSAGRRASFAEVLARRLSRVA
jgi:hypothetical protein